ncbi:MAG: MFS transporter, partial [Acidobacteria bacterium]|nr:MFS transporter [Acidobacteriota bacterium]
MSAYQRTRLFFVSSLALTMAGVGSALRANTAGDLQRVFFDPIDRVHSGEMIANVLGLPFLGFALTIAIGSPLLDYIGMGLLLPLSGVCFTVGAVLMMSAGSIAAAPGVYRVIWIGALVTGIGWGLVETVVNPLIASLYPDEKTGKLNTLHAWWPGGLVIGGLSGVAMSAAGLGWQAKLFVVVLPALAVIALSIG